MFPFQLASIPDVENKETNKPEVPSVVPTTTETNNDNEIKTELSATTEEPEKQIIPQGVLVTEHESYKKFFKMLQVGVPMRAVKMKMQAEGVDPCLLE